MNLRNLLAIVFVLGTACVGAEPSSSIKNAISECYDEGDPACLDALDSSEPDEVFDACFEEHAHCIEATMDPEACDPLLEACFGIYDESEPFEDAIGFCYDEGERCTRELGVSAEECLDILGECLESIDDHGDCDGEPFDPCEEELDMCLDHTDPESADVCFELADACYGVHEPGDCFEDWEAFDWCLASGEDPAVCEALIRCEGDPGDPGDPMPYPEDPEHPEDPMEPEDPGVPAEDPME